MKKRVKLMSEEASSKRVDDATKSPVIMDDDDAHAAQIANLSERIEMLTWALKNRGRNNHS